MPRKQLLLVIILVIATSGVVTAASATGEFTGNGDHVAITSVAVDAGDFNAMLLFTDVPLPPACGPFDAATLSLEGKIKGFAITIDKETKGKAVGGVNSLYHPSWDGQIVGNIGEPEVSIDRYDDEILSGSIKLAAGEVRGHKFAYSVQFEVPSSSVMPPIEATVDAPPDSKAAQAYANFYLAVMARRMDEAKDWAIKENAEQMAGEDAEMFLDFYVMMHPAELKVEVVSEQKDRAELKASGNLEVCMGTEATSGKVEMIKEDGGWKVKAESWE